MADCFPDLRPWDAREVEQRDAAVAEVVRREGRDAGERATDTYAARPRVTVSPAVAERRI